MYEMIKLIWNCIKTYRRIYRLQKIQSKLLNEMKIQLKFYERDKTICISTYPFRAVDDIFKHIEVLENQIDNFEGKMRKLCKAN
jgi:hypothetical protein